MSAESPKILFEREHPVEPALAIQLGNLQEDLNNPAITRILEYMNVPPEAFAALLRRDFDRTKEPNRFSVPRPTGEKIEDVEQYIVDTQLGAVEVSDCKFYQDAVMQANEMAFHLRGGFEIFYAIAGRATLSIPDAVEPIAPSAYMVSRKRTDIAMQPGTLAIVPAPTANGWSAIGEGFELRYICLPPWNPQFVRTAIDQ